MNEVFLMLVFVLLVHLSFPQSDIVHSNTKLSSLILRFQANHPRESLNIKLELEDYISQDVPHALQGNAELTWSMTHAKDKNHNLLLLHSINHIVGNPGLNCFMIRSKTLLCSTVSITSSTSPSPVHRLLHQLTQVAHKIGIDARAL